MLTPKISGYFDCRKYDATGKKQHDQRELLADTDNVTVSAVFPINEIPEVFMVNGQPDALLKFKASRREREQTTAENRQPVCDIAVAKFKIGANTRWYDSHARLCDRPSNVELEANRWDVQIDFVRKEKDAANPLKASGYWVNNIMVSKVENNPFAGQAFDPTEEPEPEDPDTAAGGTDKHDDLPFD